MNNVLIRTAFFIVVFQLSACATLFNQDAQPIYIESSPASTAEVYIHEPSKAVYTQKLPTVIYVSPSSFDALTVSFKSQCYEPIYAVVQKHITEQYWLNIFNLHGFYIDYLTGYMWDYNDKLTLPLNLIGFEKGSELSYRDDCDRLESAEVKNSIPQQATININDRLKQRRNYLNRKNMVSFGWSLNQSVDSRLSSEIALGTQFNVMRRISAENMLNLTFKSIFRDECNSYQCLDFSTNHSSQLISFRRYLTPETNFYGGLGAARVSINQTYSNYSSFDGYVEGEAWSDTFTTLFFEMGWIAREGIFSYQLHAVVDFSDIGLDRPSLSNRLYRNRDLSSRIVQERERSYLAASRVTGIEFILGVNF